jgi:hypothetical protein
MSSTDSTAFLEQAHLELYLKDVVRLLLANRTERPVDFIHHYFQNVLAGDNVILREFSYVNASSRNRLSFLMVVTDTYKTFNWTHCE